ncbi:MAG: glycosyltransferase family 39 protein [Variibacter sp.]|nr:glycosyltransferase family 39 protein [Variibacter sp.]
MPILSHLLAALDRLIARLQDPSRRDRAVALCLVAYAFVWAAYGAISFALAELPIDMAEAVAAGRDVGFGYYKHPPLSLWLPTAWFAVVPFTRFTYFLLSMTGAAIGLWAAWRLSEHWLDADKRLAGLALLTLVPFYNFHALTFNANSVLIPAWALATLWFWNSLTTRSGVFAVLAGAAVGAALLGKYWSVLLPAAFLAAALLSPHRRAYFRSSAPWLSIASGALLLAPHIRWLIVNDFPPFEYAGARREATELHSFAGAFFFAIKSLISVLAYAAVPFLLVLLALPRNGFARGRQLADVLRVGSAERRAVLAAFAVPILLPVVLGLILKVRVSSVWAMPAFTLLPPVLLGVPALALSRNWVRGIVAAAIAFPLLMLLLSPAAAWLVERQFPAPDYTRLAEQGRLFWQRSTPAPLTLVAGEPTLEVAVYLGRVSVFPRFSQRWAPWATQARIRREGMLVICPPNQEWCSKSAEAWAAQAGGFVRETVTVSSRNGRRQFALVLYAVLPARN